MHTAEQQYEHSQRLKTQTKRYSQFLVQSPRKARYRPEAKRLAFARKKGDDILYGN